MKRIIQVILNGYPLTFQLHADADVALQSYLDRAKLRLADDPDRDEVLRDLEQSIAEKLAHLPGAANRVFSGDELQAVLEAIGAVDTGAAETAAAEARPDRKRRLCRLQQGRWLAGVCQGLAAYASIGVAWVRTIFIIASVFAACVAVALLFSSFTLSFLTAVLPIAIYIALMFALPVTETRDQCVADYGKHSNAT